MTKEELRDYVEEQRNLGIIPYHVYSTLIDGIDTLEQEPILDKIIAGIEHIGGDDEKAFCKNLNESYKQGLRDALKVINRYKTESEAHNG